MKKKYLAAGAAVAATVALAGGIRASQDSADSCPKPLTSMDSEVEASVAVLEAYISTEIAPLFRKPELLMWAPQSMVPVIEASKIQLQIGVGEQWDGFADFYGPSRSYIVTMTRECANGDWEVTQFKRIGKPEPLAQKPE